MVFVLMFALLAKTKILGEEKFIQLFISFLIATIFITAASHGTVHAVTRPYAVVVAPPFSVKLLPRTRVLAYVEPVAVIFHDIPFDFFLISMVFEIISRPLSSFPLGVPPG